MEFIIYLLLLNDNTNSLIGVHKYHIFQIKYVTPYYFQFKYTHNNNKYLLTAHKIFQYRIF